MPCPEELKGDRWTEKTARLIFPILVWCAKREKKITYGQLDAELQRREWSHHVNVVMYGHPAGAIGNALIQTEQEWGEKIPPINALVVNASTGVPGKGCDYYLKSYLESRQRKDLSKRQRVAMAEEVMAEAWSYEYWDDILKEYGFKSLKGGVPSLTQNDVLPRPSYSGHSGERESDEHRQLKEWVLKHPVKLGYRTAFKKKETEKPFASLDRCDVFFENSEISVAVEVKSKKSNDLDLQRGIYQCVKYKALLRAELKARQRIPSGYSILVTERKLPLALQSLADRLGVNVLTVKR